MSCRGTFRPSSTPVRGAPMNAWMTRLTLAALVIGLAVTPAAAAPTVKDDGKLFSNTAKEKANALIADIAREFKKEVFVEAYNRPPADRAAEWNNNKSNREFVGKFFREWAERRFR